MIILAGCAGQGSGESDQQQKQYKVKGRVMRDESCPSGQGLVALLFRGGPAAQLPSARATMQAAPIQRSPWPFTKIQTLASSLQGSPLVSLAQVDERGEFGFPDEVEPGSYLVALGVPLARDPGRGISVSRTWPQQLLTSIEYTLANEQFVLPAHSAWLLQLRVRDQDVEFTLRPEDYYKWPIERPEQRSFQSLSMVQRSWEKAQQAWHGAQAAWEAADRTARQTGQPLHVSEARKLERELAEKREAESALRQQLAERLAAMFPSAQR